MSDYVLLGWLVALAVTQTAWAVYYVRRYRWRSTPLGPVWLAKGSMLALLWTLLVVDNALVDLPTWVWAYVIAPPLWLATAQWLWVTVRVARARDRGD